MRDVVLVRAESAERLRAVTSRAEQLLAQRDRGRCLDAFVDERGGVALVQGEPAWGEAVPMARGGREAFAYCGFVGLPDPSARSVRDLLAWQQGWWGRRTLRWQRSPGGIAAYFLADGRRSTCLAWSSLSGSLGLFWTKGPDAVVVSNSPLLSHLLATGRTTPTFSLQWARRILLGDSTLWNDTPYEGTSYPSPRSALVVDSAGVSELPHPLAMDAARYPVRSPEGVQALHDASLEAMAALRRMAPPELHLSGGKDSRYVAALLAKAGIRAEAVTYGVEQGGEGEAAGQVAALVRLPHRVAAQEIATGDDLEAAMVANLRRSEGLLSENRQLSYVRRAGPPGAPLLQGQAHHPRGGLYTRVQRDAAKVRARVLGQQIGDEWAIVPDLVAERRARISQLLDDYRVPHPADLSYWIYADWRAHRWLQPVYLAETRDRPLVWPMMDERVLAVCARLSTLDRVSEFAFFAALEQLAPGMGRVPLYERTWVFDRGGEAETPFPDGFAERNAPVRDHMRRPGSPEKRMATVLPLFRRTMADLPCSPELRNVIRPDILQALLAGEEAVSALGLDQQRVVRFLWKATAIGMVLDGKWLPAPDAGESRQERPAPPPRREDLAQA